MSTEIMKDIICPQCGEAQKYRIYTSINGTDNPELKDLIMSEELFDWRCNRCNYFADMAYPFVYTDTQKKYMICLSPMGTSNIEPPAVFDKYIKRSVKNLSELKEKILMFDEGIDDVAMELVKNALCGIVKQTYKVNRVHAYFSRENEGELEFAIFLPNKKDAIYHSTKSDVYGQSQEVLRALDYTEPEGFLKVDARLARKVLEDYQNI